MSLYKYFKKTDHDCQRIHFYQNLMGKTEFIMFINNEVKMHVRYKPCFLNVDVLITKSFIREGRSWAKFYTVEIKITYGTLCVYYKFMYM